LISFPTRARGGWARSEPRLRPGDAPVTGPFGEGLPTTAVNILTPPFGRPWISNCGGALGPFQMQASITPAAKKVIYQPEARARDPVRFPRWRVGLICSSMRNFLAGVIARRNRLAAKTISCRVIPGLLFWVFDPCFIRGS
jgi:hypothetical protein